MPLPPTTPLGFLVVPLLRGVIARDVDGARWNELIARQAEVRDYLSVIGLDVLVDAAQGYAYARQRTSDDPDVSIPRLMQRRALSYRVSLLLVLLRKRMLEQDANSGDARLVVSRTEIGEMLRAFLVGSGNEAKVLDQLDKLIGKVVELGFLRALRETDADVEDRYEIRRVIKAFVDAQWMNEFNAKLEVYRQKAFGDVGDGS